MASSDEIAKFSFKINLHIFFENEKQISRSLGREQDRETVRYAQGQCSWSKVALGLKVEKTLGGVIKIPSVS